MSIGRPNKEGYLIKEGFKVKNWKKRWFVLGNETFSYYRNQKSLKKVLGVIPLKDITEVEFFSHKKKGDNTLQIKTARRTYFIITDARNAKDVLTEWKNAVFTQSEISQGKRVHTTNEEREAEIDEHDDKINIDSFELLTIIGQGSFGKVVQVRMKSTGDIFAMKVLNKKNIVDRGEVAHTIAERNILMRINHPFLMKLYYSFQTADKLYLVMDFVNGGELFYHLQSDRKFSNERARFYAAEIVLGLEHLHTNGIIYRDLKPENLLLDSSGHIKMTDFGLSKEGLEDDGKTTTFCGTPEYLAPEVLDGKQYGKAVDWWSLGTLIFEMLTGLPPFYDEDVQKMYNQKMTATLVVPDSVEASAKDIITKFLDRNPETRLHNPDTIKSHPYFQGIDWIKLYHREIEPPYKPTVANKESTKMIDKAFTNMDVSKELSQKSEPVNDTFEGFTYQSGTPAGQK